MILQKLVLMLIGCLGVIFFWLKQSGYYPNATAIIALVLIGVLCACIIYLSIQLDNSYRKRRKDNQANLRSKS
jgi:hypothetical protein